MTHSDQHPDGQHTHLGHRSSPPRACSGTRGFIHPHCLSPGLVKRGEYHVNPAIHFPARSRDWHGRQQNLPTPECTDMAGTPRFVLMIRPLPLVSWDAHQLMCWAVSFV